MTAYGKPTDGFTRLGTSLEPVGADLGTSMTPLDRFFVCTAGDAPDLDPTSWVLAVSGDAVDQDVRLSLTDLRSLPMAEITAWLECAGNGRTLFRHVAGHQVQLSDRNTLWTLGAMGIASWRGPRLADVLAVAGLTDDAAWAAPVGLDRDNPEGEPIRMCLPLHKALDPDTIVALDMNGAPLPRSHGAPARLIVPGWVGAYSVKWLGELTVSARWVPSWRADEYYVHRSPDGTAGPPLTAHPVKSSLALPFPADLVGGHHHLWGYARSGNGPITGVDYAVDDDPWTEAELDPVGGATGWTIFRFEVDLDGGDHVVRTRATDGSGATQPDEQPLHPNGVLWQSVIPHPITVI